MLSLLYGRVVAAMLLVTGAAVATTRANAQAIPTVQRGAEFAPFAMVTSINPDWGQTRNLGYTAGLDYTRFIPAIVQPSLEFRASHASGRTVNQSTYLGGVKIQTTIHNLHPYAVVLAGKGITTFNYFYNGGLKGDDSAVYAYGGGVEFNAARSWKVRADYVQQRWNFDPNTLTPSALAVGIAYSVPFHNRGGIR